MYIAKELIKSEKNYDELVLNDEYISSKRAIKNDLSPVVVKVESTARGFYRDGSSIYALDEE